MPEYLAPGVYVEEVSYRAKTIEGVSTSTAGFVGPARFGPVGGTPTLITSFAEFERIFGGLEQLEYAGARHHNYLAHGVKAFFEQGGRRVYVTRVWGGGGATIPTTPPAAVPQQHGRVQLITGSTPQTVYARFPGAAGNMRVTFVARASENLWSGSGPLRRVQVGDTVVLSAGGNHTPHDVYRNDTTGVLELRTAANANPAVLGANDSVRLIRIDVWIERPVVRGSPPREQFSPTEVYEGFAISRRHNRSLLRTFVWDPPTSSLWATIPIALLAVENDARTGVAWLADLFDGIQNVPATLGAGTTITRSLTLRDGTDGTLPAAADFLGGVTTTTPPIRTGLASLEDIEDVSIVAIPGYSAASMGDQTRRRTIEGHLIGHCERMRYRIAVLDSREGAGINDVRQDRGVVDSTYAALYYPWITILDPVTDEEQNMPPSGFMAGIFARNDVQYGVHKAPANETVQGIVGFEHTLNKGQQDVLNPEGINCFRFFPGRGFRIWGARTVSSDPEWKYVNVRRYFAYLERSIDKGTQWAVFMNNSDPLWANVRRTIEDFLFNEWTNGRLMGADPKSAYFVRCDRTTMTQNDIDNGRLVCLVGVCPVRPAEFVIFRIGQWTADRKS